MLKTSTKFWSRVIQGSAIGISASIPFGFAWLSDLRYCPGDMWNHAVLSVALALMASVAIALPEDHAVAVVIVGGLAGTVITLALQPNSFFTGIGLLLGFFFGIIERYLISLFSDSWQLGIVAIFGALISGLMCATYSVPFVNCRPLS